jgi:signal transduction histidine kinase/CheY-like chemotaxis protein
MAPAPGILQTDGAHAAFDALPTPVAVVDATLTIGWANTVLARLLGVDRERLTGMSLTQAVNEAGGALEEDDAGAVVHLQSQAGEIWLRLTIAPTGDGALATFADISAERRTLAEMNATNWVRDQLMFDAEVGVWNYDPGDDSFVFSHALNLGYPGSGSRVPADVLRQIQHPRDAAIDLEIRERIICSGGVAEAEMRYWHASGSWQHLNVHYRSGRMRPDGLYELLGISQNITPLANARDEASAVASRLKLALTSAKAGVCELDYRKGLFWGSPEFVQLTGRPTPERIDDTLALYNPEDHEVVRSLRREASADGSSTSVDVRLAHPEGERWVRLSLEVVYDEAGEPVRGVGLMLDVDEQKRQELALEEARRIAEAATAAKSTFLASVSHEIRTPMNGIVGVLNLLRHETLTEEGRSLLTEAVGCSEMLAQLINDVLDFSKIEAGKLELSPTIDAPQAIAEGVANLLRPQATDKGLYLRLVTQPEIGFAEIDSVRLRQCLFNVVGNAVKFTESGGVEVRLSTVGDGADRMLRCEIQDTGIGVPDSARATMFGQFQQADATTTRRFGGTGLGLAISRKLARMMGGELDYDSEPGVGSTFWLEVAAPVAAAPDAAEIEDLSAIPLEGLRVLVVDDNRINRIVAVKTLEALGAEAEAVDSGQAAIEAVGQSAFDLVLMDVNMPEMDGLEATRRIRALPSAVAAIPIIALTADVMSHQHKAYLKVGMDGVVPKPFSPTQLINAIAALAERSQDEMADARAAAS